MTGGAAAFDASAFVRTVRHKRRDSRTGKAMQSQIDGLWPNLAC